MLPLFPDRPPHKRKGLEAQGLCPHCRHPFVNLPESPYASCSVPCGKARLVPRFSRGELHAFWVDRLPVAEPRKIAGSRQGWRISGHDGWWEVAKPHEGIQAKRQTETRLYIKWFRRVDVGFGHEVL